MKDKMKIISVTDLSCMGPSDQNNNLKIQLIDLIKVGIDL